MSRWNLFGISLLFALAFASCKQKQSLDDLYDSALNIGKADTDAIASEKSTPANETNQIEKSNPATDSVEDSLQKTFPLLVKIEGELGSGGWKNITSGAIFDIDGGWVVTPHQNLSKYTRFRTIPHQAAILYRFSPHSTGLAFWQFDQSGMVFDAPEDFSGSLAYATPTYIVGLVHGSVPVVVSTAIASIPIGAEYANARLENDDTMIRLMLPFVSDIAGGVATTTDGKWLGIVLPQTTDRLTRVFPIQTLRARVSRDPLESERLAALERIEEEEEEPSSEAVEPTEQEPAENNPNEEQSPPNENNKPENNTEEQEAATETEPVSTPEPTPEPSPQPTTPQPEERQTEAVEQTGDPTAQPVANEPLPQAEIQNRQNQPPATPAGTANNSGPVNVTLGMKVKVADEQIRQRLGVAIGSIIVISVAPGGPAQQAQISIDDSLVEINGRAIQNTIDLITAMKSLRPNVPARFVIVRNGVRQTVQLTPQLKP